MSSVSGQWKGDIFCKYREIVSRSWCQHKTRREGKKNEMHLERTIEFFRPVVYSTLFSLDVMVPFFQTSCALSISRVLGQRGGTKSSEIGEGCRIFWISTVFSRISLKRQRSFSCASRFSARGASSMQGFGSATTRSCYRSLLSVLPSLSLLFYLLLSRSLSVLLIFEHN